MLEAVASVLRKFLRSIFNPFELTASAFGLSSTWLQAADKLLGHTCCVFSLGWKLHLRSPVLGLKLPTANSVLQIQDVSFQHSS